MPQQGQSIGSCTITKWNVSAGDAVNEGDVVCEVETGKASFEVESPTDGSVLAIHHPAGSDVDVYQPIAVIGKPGENFAALKPEAVEPAVETAGEPDPPYAPHQPGASFAAGAGVSPRAKNSALAKGVDVATISGTGPHRRVIERDVLAAKVAMPLCEAVPIQDRPQTAPADPLGETEEIPVKGLRKVVADRMLYSLRNTAQLTLNTSVDARAVLKFRKTCKTSARLEKYGKCSINDVVLFATVQTLRAFPEMNAHWLGNRVIRFKSIHLGFAVDTPNGLMAPVIRNTEKLSLSRLVAETKRLSDACIKGTINPDDLTGSTFTVTNLGTLGIESFTPVLNAPEVGILGVCAIQPKPVMVGEEIRFIPHMGLSLTFDHCATDGTPAARFLAALRDKLVHFDLTLCEAFFMY